MKSLDLNSLAIHSGEQTRVRLSVSPGNGTVYIRSSIHLDEVFYEKNGIYPQRLSSLKAHRASEFQLNSGRTLKTCEHFLSALILFYPNLIRAKLNLRIHLEGDEFPILDGTIGPWWKALHQLCQSKEPETLQIEEYNPQFSMSIRYAGKEVLWGPNNPLRVQSLIQAPTFSSWSEYILAKDKGLVKGGRPSNAHVYLGTIKRPMPLTWNTSIYPQGLNPNSFCHHKLVDFIGDLAILSLKFPSGHYEVQDGGHFQHHQILKGIYHDIS